MLIEAFWYTERLCSASDYERLDFVTRLLKNLVQDIMSNHSLIHSGSSEAHSNTSV